MKPKMLVRFVPFLLILVLLAESAIFTSAQEHKALPKTQTDNVTETIHGVAITDPYRWLEDQNSPETRAWINAQNEYTNSMLSGFAGRDKIHQRLEELMKIDTLAAPFEKGGRYFIRKRSADQNQFVIYVRNGLNGKDEVLIDGNTLSADQNASASIMDVTHDGKHMAYGIRQGGEDEVTVSIMNVDTRKDLPDKLPRARYFGVSVKPDASGFYYTAFGKEGPRVYYHAMGTKPAGDRKIFGDGYGPGTIIGSALSEDGRYLLMVVSFGSSADKTEVWVQNLESGGPITAIVKDIPARFSPEIAADTMFMQTNWNAENGKVLAVDLKKPARENWREVVPQSQFTIDGVSAAGGKLFVNYIENVATKIKVFDPSGKPLGDVKLPGLGTASGMGGEWTKDEAFYTFNSFAQPTIIYRYQVSTGKQEEWARIKVPVASDQIEVKQVWYESKDKTRVPMFVVHKKGLKLDGSRPTLLTAYGGFNVSLTPGFSAIAALWAEMGGVFAQPNLRGGGEFGEKWHKAGMFGNKQNVFDDFIAAAEWLTKNNYTNSSKLAIRGGSNGGLLVGAVMTQRPELYQAVVCAVPLLDMLRYQNFLVARFWVPEYGSAEDAEQFKYIYAYSPYHRVKKGTNYPAVFFTTGDGDTRVAPLHARKMTALMQASTGSNRPILLHYDTKAGHSGGLPVNKQVDDITEELCFLFWQLGVSAK
ncbi:MAG: prolyl oligopeptidase family serine peptidase [Acidobacteriota bacterium]